MGRYVLQRLALAVPTLILLTFAAFLLTSAAKGDPAMNALRAGGQDPSPQLLVQYREELGLNDPLPVRYLSWLGGALHGDFGKSIIDQRDVSEILGDRIVPTLRLGIAAFMFATLVGVAAGVVFGLFANTWIDHTGRFFALLLASIPSFWLALLLILFVSEKWGFLPVAGYGGPRYMVLPILALSLGPAASLMRFTRSYIIEVWRQDYIRTARAKGVADFPLVVRHAIPNTMLPIVTILGLRFGQILAGAIVIESIFAWPGMGSALIGAISGRDLPVISAYVTITGVMFILVNLMTDISYAWLDPRVRLNATGGRS